MKKRLKLKANVKQFLMIFSLFVVVAIMLYSINKLDKKFVKDCMNAGYSENYCLKNK